MNVTITAPGALNSRDRAKVVMEAAKQIHASEVYDDQIKFKYDYIFVSLEASKNNLGQGFILAEAEFAPDGAGSLGPLGNSENKWKWNVRSSNIIIHAFPCSKMSLMLF